MPSSIGETRPLEEVVVRLAIEEVVARVRTSPSFRSIT